MSGTGSARGIRQLDADEFLAAAEIEACADHCGMRKLLGTQCLLVVENLQPGKDAKLLALCIQENEFPAPAKSQHAIVGHHER